MKEIQEFFANLKNTFPSFGVMDLIDILVVAGLIYYVIKLIWNTSARRIAWAIVILLLATLLTDLLNLHTVNYLLDRVLELGFVALVIVFQPELRRLLERVGGSTSNVKNFFGLTDGAGPSDGPEAIEQVVQACEAMSAERVGALIVFERSNSLEQIAATGTRVDAAVSQELIRNIFFPKASLHASVRESKPVHGPGHPPQGRRRHERKLRRRGGHRLGGDRGHLRGHRRDAEAASGRPDPPQAADQRAHRRGKAAEQRTGYHQAQGPQKGRRGRCLKAERS